jgi:TolA-binding protein
MREKDLREQTRYRLGTAYFNKGDYENSARQFDIFLAEFSESPMQPSAHFHAGESRMQLKEYIDAREHFAAVVKTEDPKLLKMALIRLAETQALTRQWPEAAKSYADFLASFGKSPWAPRAQYGLGWALEKQGRYEEAMAEYRKVLARKLKDELSARSQFQIGECLFSMRKHDAAIQELMRVSTNYREREWTIKAFLEIGRVLESDGQKDKAIDQFKEVIRRFPKHDAATVAKQRLDVLRRM